MTAPGPMGRQGKLLHGLDLAHQAGLEVGALDHPLVRKSEGDISYVDYADAAFLRHKYRDDPGVTPSEVVEVDCIWGGRTMAEAVGGRSFDYALASHVVEHVPDLIAWLSELHAVLRPGATLRLAVPDLRYTFDFRRQASDVADVITANVLGARAPMPGQLIDSCLNHHVIDRALLWRGDTGAVPRYPPRDRLRHAIACARTAAATGEYIDVHCWTFTPASFAAVLEQLCALGFVRFECARCFDTEPGEDEFIVILRAGEDEVACAESWRRTGEALADTAAAPSAAELMQALGDATRALAEATARHAADIARLQDGFVALERRAAPAAWVARRLLARIRRPAA